MTELSPGIVAGLGMSIVFIGLPRWRVGFL